MVRGTRSRDRDNWKIQESEKQTRGMWGRHKMHSSKDLNTSRVT